MKSKTDADRRAPVVRELSHVPDVFLSLQRMADLPGVLLLDSARQDGAGRFSFLMADPIEWFEIQSVEFGADPFAELRPRFDDCRLPAIDGLPPFQGGFAGLLGYELGRAWERLPISKFDEFGLPVMAVGLYDRVLAWDHQQRRAWVVAQNHESFGTDPQKRVAEFVERLASSADDLSSSALSSTEFERTDESELAAQFRAIGPAGLTSDFSADDYRSSIQKVIDYIYAGDIFQANLSQRLMFPQRQSALELYEKLRERNAAPFAGYFCHDDWALLSASPERFIRVDDRLVETRPIKGTRQRRSVPEADLFSRDELRESDKDRAENVMIVDLLRNDLSKVCEAGSIRVPKLCEVETYETVQHLVSIVEGSLRLDADIWDLFEATFPGGSITGAPKVRAMEIIAEIEPTVRGPYCGSLFYAGFNGQVDSSILIRTFIQRHGWLQCSVGGGIVAQSNPQAEFEETLHKAEGMLRALDVTSN